MKFTITFKTPDAVKDVVNDLVPRIPKDQRGNRLDMEAHDEAVEEISSQVRNVTDLFMSYSEYVTIEFDTETKSATVVRVK